MPTLGVFAAIVDEGGRILCVRMNYATHGWTTPGGGVEAGESPLHALQREVREESGLDVIADGLVGVYCKPYKDDIVLFFRARVLAAIRGNRMTKYLRWGTSAAMSCRSLWVSAPEPASSMRWTALPGSCESFQ
jgi:ADP-ribose pyrophosphatase YjhB (NUDIX family)